MGQLQWDKPSPSGSGYSGRRVTESWFSLVGPQEEHVFLQVPAVREEGLLFHMKHFPVAQETHGGHRVHEEGLVQGFDFIHMQEE